MGVSKHYQLEYNITYTLVSSVNLTFGEEHLQEGMITAIHGLGEILVQGVHISNHEITGIINHGASIVLNSEEKIEKEKNTCIDVLLFLPKADRLT